MVEKTYDVRKTDKVHQTNYDPIISCEEFFDKSIPSTLAGKILNIITGNNYSITKWKSMKRFNITWNDKDKKTITYIDFYSLVESLKKNRKFNHQELNLPILPPCWIDKSIEMASPNYFPSNEDESSMTFELGTNFGTMYPIKPNIDREGIISASLLNQVEHNMIIFRNDLIANSKYMFNLEGGIWFGKLLCYLNILVSSLDITLIHLYYKAKFDDEARLKFHWKFDESSIGSSRTTKITDKLKWVHQITGNFLPCLDKELNSFNIIRGVRNHLSHFDPPVFACTIEDLSEWINCSFNIGLLLTKIRESINGNISMNLIELLLQNPVRFEPVDPGKKRYLQTESGYKSCFEQYLPENSVKLQWGKGE